MPFSERFRRHLSLRPSVVIEICSALRSPCPPPETAVPRSCRLGRSLRDLITMLDDLKQRGVKFRSLTEAIDTETPTGRDMWQMIGVLAKGPALPPIPSD